MPLLGQRIHVLNQRVKKEKKAKDGSTSSASKPPKFVIRHTGEVCDTEEEYNRKVKIYAEKLWTCRCTGKTNLNHEGALNSEKNTLKLLKKGVAKCFEKAILEIVHHSVESLDILVHKAWLLLQTELCLNEPVTLKVSSTSKENITGVIIKVDKPAEESPVKTNGTTSPSSSDKENTVKKSSGQPQKKNYFYSVKLLNEDKIVSRIPVSAINRDFRPPFKDQVRLFIRAHSMRFGANHTGPWSVNDDVMRKYKIKSKDPKYEVDKNRLKKLSVQHEVETYQRLMKGSPGSGSGGGGKKGKKRIAVLRGEIALETKMSSIKFSVDEDEDEDDENVPLMVIKKKQDQKAAVIPPPGGAKGKKLKQATLFDLGSSGKSSSSKSGSAIKSIFATPNRILPPIATRLIKMVREKKPEAVVSQMISRCAQMLTDAQIQNIPAEIRDRIKQRKVKIEEKKRLEAMTPEDREDFLKQRRLKLKQEQMERRDEQRREQNRRFEDSQLDTSPLPAASSVVLSKRSLTANQVGSILGLAEMFRCFKGLLLPPESEEQWRSWERGGSEWRAVYGTTVVHAERLCESLEAGPEGFLYLGHTLTVLLQTILQDDVMNRRRELGSKLSEIPVTPYTASEMLRLVLSPSRGQSKRHAATTTPKDKNKISENGEEVDETVEDDAESEESYEDESEDESTEDEAEVAQLCARLEICEFLDLTFDEKLRLLEIIQQRLLDLEMLNEHIESVQRKCADAWKKKTAELKRKNDRVREERAKRKEENAKKEPSSGKKEAVAAAAPVVVKEVASDDLASIVKRRRILAAQAAAEREVKEKEERERRAIEAVQQAEHRTLYAVSKELEQVALESRGVLRLAPLGTDRSHCRYWRFPAAPPGIYVESGWAVTEEATSDNLHASPAKSLRKSTSAASLPLTPADNETTAPSPTEPLHWQVYNSEDQLDALLAALHPKGVRESVLKEELSRVIDEEKARIRAFRQANSKKTGSAPSESDKTEDILINGFKTELNETCQRIVNGSLSISPDITNWQSRLVGAKNRVQLSRCLTEVQSNLLERFMCGPFQPKRPHATESESAGQLIESLWVSQWKEAVVGAKTQSRLNLLQGYLDSCIRWEKSTEDAKCRICRQKSNELLLCDQCNQTFHLFCLRPPLTKVPRGDWFCPSCKPPERRSRKDDEGGKGRRRPNYEESDNFDSDEESEEEVEGHYNDASCLTCQDEAGELVGCAGCTNSFHLLCHEPPLRTLPRGDWFCMHCRRGGSPGKSRTSAKKSGPTGKRKAGGGGRGTAKETTGGSGRKASRTIGRYKEESDSDGESEEETVTRRSGGRKSATLAKKTPASKKSTGGQSAGTRSSSRAKRATVISHNSSEEEEEEEEASSSDDEQARKSSRRTARTSSRKRARVTSDDEEEEDEEVELPPPGKRAKLSTTANGAAAAAAAIAAMGRACKTILDNLYRHRSAWPFHDAVDREEVPDYYTIIKQPMDLSTMKLKLKAGQYTSLEHMVEDVSLMFANAESYNLATTDIYKASNKLEEYFVTQLARLAPDINYTRRLTAS